MGISLSNDVSPASSVQTHESGRTTPTVDTNTSLRSSLASNEGRPPQEPSGRSLGKSPASRDSAGPASRDSAGPAARRLQSTRSSLDNAPTQSVTNGSFPHSASGESVASPLALASVSNIMARPRAYPPPAARTFTSTVPKTASRTPTEVDRSAPSDCVDAPVDLFEFEKLDEEVIPALGERMGPRQAARAGSAVSSLASSTTEGRRRSRESAITWTEGALFPEAAESAAPPNPQQSLLTALADETHTALLASSHSMQSANVDLMGYTCDDDVVFPPHNYIAPSAIRGQSSVVQDGDVSLQIGSSDSTKWSEAEIKPIISSPNCGDTVQPRVVPVALRVSGQHSLDESGSFTSPPGQGSMFAESISAEESRTPRGFELNTSALLRGGDCSPDRSMVRCGCASDGHDDGVLQPSPPRAPKKVPLKMMPLAPSPSKPVSSRRRPATPSPQSITQRQGSK